MVFGVDDVLAGMSFLGGGFDFVVEGFYGDWILGCGYYGGLFGWYVLGEISG